MKRKSFVCFFCIFLFCFTLSSCESNRQSLEEIPLSSEATNIIPTPVDSQNTKQTSNISSSSITDISWDTGGHFIDVKIDPWPEDYSGLKVLVDGAEIPFGEAEGSLDIRPNAPVEESPDGFIIATLPWVSGLDNVDLPCCGSLQLLFPDGSLTNAYDYNLVDSGCQTASSVVCTSSQEEPIQTQPGQQIAGGHLAEDTIWYGDILVVNDIYVPEGVTLTIEPGTTVQFKHYRGYQEPEKRIGMEIDGTIIAQGEPDRPIYFTSDADDPQNGDWRMIRVLESDDSIFDHVVVEFGQQGLNFWGGKPKIHNSVVRWNNWEGIYFESYAQGEIVNSHIYQNGYNGMAAEQYNDLVIDGCIFEKSGTHGIHLDATSAIVKSTQLLDNGAGGLSVDNGGSVIAKGVLSSRNGEGITAGEGDNTVQLGNVQVTANRNCQICCSSTQIEDATPIPEQIIFDFSPDMSYELGYTPGDEKLDQYAYVYDAVDDTRAVVKQIGEGLGLTWAVAWDGEAVWTASLWAEYYRIDPDSGEILSHFQGPGSQIWGLTFDGEHLWALDFAERMIYEVDPDSGKTLSQFPSPDPDNGCKGLTWDGQYLYVAGWATDFIYIMDREGNLMGTIDKEGDWGVGGLAWDGEYFWSPGGKGIVRSTKDGEVLGWIYTASEGTWDMAWGDGLLWASQRTNENWSDAKIYGIEILDAQNY